MRERVWVRLEGLRVVALLLAYLTLIVASVFVMDWFVSPSQSSDLWAVTRCNGASCASSPLNGEHQVVAALTLWSTLLAAVPVLVAVGGYLFIGRTWRHIHVPAFVSAIGSVMFTAVTATTGTAGDATLAAFVLAIAHLVGLVAVLMVTDRSEVPLSLAGRDRGFPSARVHSRD